MSIPIVAFRVPNTPQGVRFLAQARVYVNRERYSKVKTRPRGNRKKGAYDSERDGCKSFGVYLEESDAARAELADHIHRTAARMAEDFNKQRDLSVAAVETHLDTVREIQREDIRKLTIRVSNWQIATAVAFLTGLTIGMIAMHEIVANGAKVVGPLF